MDLASLAAQVSSGVVSSHYITSRSTYHHYLCDGFDDRGWGCGYRTLQSLCSWVIGKQGLGHVTPPSLHGIQEVLVDVGDKPQSFLRSREWIGCFEASIVLDHLYGVSSKIIHVPSGGVVKDHVTTLYEHFENIGSPAMIGGDVDGSSKTLIGMSLDKDDVRFLIADPHYQGPPDVEKVVAEGFVKWHGLELFQTSSFYNFCLPQLRLS